jgi:hypothetical protein
MTHGPHTSLQTNVHKMEGQVESNKATCGNLKMRIMTLEKEKK